MSPSPDAVTHHAAASRFELQTPHGTAAAAYVPGEGRAVFVHTDVPPEDQGQGWGAALVQGALDQVRAMGWKAVPQCPFVQAFVERHPGYADLVA